MHSDIQKCELVLNRRFIVFVFLKSNLRQVGLAEDALFRLIL